MPSITQEAKDTLIEALNKLYYGAWEDIIRCYGVNKSGPKEELNERYELLKSHIESFPVSDGGKPNPTDNWIPCSERFPKDWEEVLFHPRSKLSFSAKHYGGMWFDGYSTHGVQYEVTHWCPFPNPPTSHK